MHPDRIVIGAQSQHAADLMKKVYEPFMAPVLVTGINSAELIKHAANSFLALKISYINAISAICDASGADVEKVADGIGMDRRIGRQFLNAGIGYGGSAFFINHTPPTPQSHAKHRASSLSLTKTPLHTTPPTASPPHPPHHPSC